MIIEKSFNLIYITQIVIKRRAHFILKKKNINKSKNEWDFITGKVIFSLKNNPPRTVCFIIFLSHLKYLVSFHCLLGDLAVSLFLLRLLLLANSLRFKNSYCPYKFWWIILWLRSTFFYAPSKMLLTKISDWELNLFSSCFSSEL
jgi:hypothetical protein